MKMQDFSVSVPVDLSVFLLSAVAIWIVFAVALLYMDVSNESAKSTLSFMEEMRMSPSLFREFLFINIIIPSLIVLTVIMMSI